jgi:uncharacterized protein involved in outer membrane biogenesis
VIEAGLRAAPGPDGLTATAEVKADDVAVESVAGLLGLAGVTGIGEVSARMSGAGATWGDLAASLAGTAEVDLRDGTVQGIDVSRVPGALVEGGTPSLGGSTSFSQLGANVTAAAGLLATDDFHAEGPGYVLDLVGKIATGGPSVEARGVLTLLGEAPREVPFLVNGPWAAPAFQPDLGGPLPLGPIEDRAAVPSDG